jgi:asparagine synthase (glutamine-hydrolysing)
MSGIAAIFNVTGEPVQPEIIRRMTSRIAHRGPDGAGHWSDGCVALGHRLFSTTPESIDETQPLIARGLGLVAVADARVDNRTELASALRAGGAGPEGVTDAELILRAYALWGDRCGERIVGDFACVIWDVNRRRLVMLRDRLGIKPLLYWFDGKVLLVASEPRQVYAHPAVSRDVNWACVAEQIIGAAPDPDETLYAGVRWVRAGHAAAADQAGLRLWRYWAPSLDREIRYRTHEEYVDHFRDLLREAIRCRLRSSTPVGVLLSGGLDSSSLACFAKKILKDDPAGCAPIETLSLTYPGLACDETEFIHEVQRELGVPSHTIAYGEQFHAAASLEHDRAKEFRDSTYHSSPMAQERMFAEHAKRRGIRVLFDGIGGDELFIRSWARIADSLRAVQLPLLARQLRSAADGRQMSRWRALFDYGCRPLVPEKIKDGVRAVRRRVARARGTDVPDWLDPAFVRSVSLADRARRRTRVTAARCRTSAQRTLHRELTCGYNILLAMPEIERVSSAMTVERRHPFLDSRLAEFCLAVPDQELQAEELPKSLLREALHGVLPESIRLRRSKATFDCLVAEELNARQTKRVDAIFESLQLEAAGVLKKGGGRRLLERYRHGHDDAQNPLSETLALELWYREFQRQPQEDRWLAATR